MEINTFSNTKLAFIVKTTVDQVFIQVVGHQLFMAGNGVLVFVWVTVQDWLMLFSAGFVVRIIKHVHQVGFFLAGLFIDISKELKMLLELLKSVLHGVSIPVCLVLGVVSAVK